MADSDALGPLIRGARLDKGLSLGQFASAVGRSPSSVRRWERGEATPSVDVVGDVAAILGLDAEEFGAMIASAHGSEDRTEQPLTSDNHPDVVADSPATAPRAKTTLEHEHAAVEIAPYFETPTPVMPPPVQRPPSRFKRASSAIMGHRDSWIGWVRGFLTALALFFLFMGFMWAAGELLTALKEVLGSFSTGL
jgi:transcriptional regulator with XRE-family HTH domain